MRKSWDDWFDLFLVSLRGEHRYSENLIDVEIDRADQIRETYYQVGMEPGEAAAVHAQRVEEAAGVADEEAASSGGDVIGMLHLLNQSRESSRDPQRALERPEYILRCVIVDAAKMWYDFYGEEPTTVYITPAIEVLLEKDRQYQLPGSIPLREETYYMGWRIVFNAQEFKFE